MGWKSRIIGHGEEQPDQLLANPKNWRIHPEVQQKALESVLNDVGWVQDVIVNQRTGHVVDGHLRVSLAISREEPAVPVVYVDLDEAEEALVLASLDPLSLMAATDQDKMAELLEEITLSSEELEAKLRELSGNTKERLEELAQEHEPASVFAVIVNCESEEQQRMVLEWCDQGQLSCRVLIS